jgi:hypothetical protein
MSTTDDINGNGDVDSRFSPKADTLLHFYGVRHRKFIVAGTEFAGLVSIRGYGWDCFCVFLACLGEVLGAYFIKEALGLRPLASLLLLAPIALDALLIYFNSVCNASIDYHTNRKEELQLRTEHPDNTIVDQAMGMISQGESAIKKASYARALLHFLLVLVALVKIGLFCFGKLELGGWSQILGSSDLLVIILAYAGTGLIHILATPYWWRGFRLVSGFAGDLKIFRDNLGNPPQNPCLFAPRVTDVAHVAGLGGVPALMPGAALPVLHGPATERLSVDQGAMSVQGYLPDREVEKFLVSPAVQQSIPGGAEVLKISIYRACLALQLQWLGVYK